MLSISAKPESILAVPFFYSVWLCVGFPSIRFVKSRVRSDKWWLVKNSYSAHVCRQLILLNQEWQVWLLLAVSALSAVDKFLQTTTRCYIWSDPLQSGGQQILVLVPRLGLSVAWGQHRQPLWARGNPAGSVQDQTEEKEEDGDKSVAGDGHQRCWGEPRHSLFRFHDGDWKAVSRRNYFEFTFVPWCPSLFMRGRLSLSISGVLI